MFCLYLAYSTHFPALTLPCVAATRGQSYHSQKFPLYPTTKKQKALKRKAATLMKMVQAGNTKTLPPEQSAAEHPAQALVHFMSPGHSLTPCSKWLMPPLGMGMLWATFWGASSTWGRIRPPVHLSFLSYVSYLDALRLWCAARPWA